MPEASTESTGMERLRWPLLIGLALAVTCGTASQAAAQTASDAELPPGVRAVWDVAKAYREATPTRERICINGLWRFKPADGKPAQVPTGNWGFLKVPGPWPQYATRPWMADESQKVYRHPAWKDRPLSKVDTAWYQRELSLPREWSGRRIVLRADYVYSYAAVYLDQERVGEIYFPGGELDITSACRPGQKQVLSLFIATIPLPKDLNGYALRQDLDAYLAKPPEKRTKGFGPFRGLCGDVFVESMPEGPRIDDVKVNTSVRNWQIEVDAALGALAQGEAYALRGRLLDGGRLVKEIKSQPLTAADLRSGRITFASPWRPEKLWDVNTPQNQYELELTLVDSAGRALDEFRPVRFGFREFWIDGRDFRLNGTRIYWVAVPLDNAQMSPAMADYESARRTFSRLKQAGINMMYTHNYKCLPGVHLAFGEILRAADDVGMMVSFTVPNWSSYAWPWNAKDPEKTNGYPQDAGFYVRQAQNHPSVVAYSTSHLSFGYAQDQNPDLIDGKGERTGRWADVGRIVEKSIHVYDATRPIYHHAAGNFGQMYTINCYLDFVPIQERSDWFEHWATEGVKPLFPNEYGVPFDENWSSFREGYGIFGWRLLLEFLYPEWGSQFRGDVAYRLSDEEIANIRWEAEKWRKQEMFHKSEYPFRAGVMTAPNIRGVQAMYISRNWPAFRTWGVSGLNFWRASVNWTLRPDAARVVPQPETDWDNLQRPGYSPDYNQPRNIARELVYDESDWVPTLVGEAFLRYNRPVLAYIAGKPGRFTSQDHNFSPGEAVEKQSIIINNSRRPVTVECVWSVNLPEPVGGTQRVTVETGEQARLPIRFELPPTVPSGRYALSMTARLDTGETQADSFAIDVLAPAGKPVVRQKVALYDPQGETAALLSARGVAYDSVDVDADLDGYDVLIIGKKALTPFGPGPDVSRVRDGLRVVVFEQTKETLEKRLGFRVQEYALRRVFPRVPDHPVLAGLKAGNLHDWRGEGTTVPPRLEGADISTQVVPHGTWAGFRNPRPWRAGCYGSVASLLMEKPAAGDFLPIVDGGFSLQYAPLMEYRTGRGMVLFCQMDVTGRTQDDPAATRLVGNILQYVSSWKPAPRRTALYVGDPAGKRHLESTGLNVADYAGGPLSGDQVLVVGPGGGQELSARKDAIAAWLKAGGHLLAIGLDQEQANAFLPIEVTLKEAEHISAYFEPPGKDSPFAGIGPADVYIRDPRPLPLAADGTEPLGDGVLARARDARVVFCALVPWEFDYDKPNGAAWTFDHKSHNVKYTFRRSSFALTRLLANMGVAAPTPILKRLQEPAVDEESLQDLVDAAWLESGDDEFVLSTRWKGFALPNHHSFEKGLPEGWQTAGFDDAEWRPIRVPGLWRERYKDLANMRGTMLYRLNFDLPEGWARKDDVAFVLGKVADQDWTYLNGKLIGKTTTKNTKGNLERKLRRYDIPAGLLKPGRNVLAFADDTWGAGGVRPAGQKRQKKRLENVTAYLAPEGVRYIHGLYLDAPERLDDPYRYLRW